MSTLAKVITYGIIAAVVVAALTHPAGAAGLMTGGTSFLESETGSLTGANQTGGVTGTVVGAGNTFRF